jgi:integrase
MEPVQYRGFTITRHGKRWRFQTRMDGRKVRPAFDEISDAKRAIDSILVMRGDGPTWTHQLGRGHKTVGALCEAWLAWKTSAESDEPIRPRTERDYRRCLTKYIDPLIGLRDAATLSTSDLKREFFRVCPSRTGARFSRTILQQAFRWGIEQQLVARRDNPCVDVRLVRRDGSDGRNRKVTSIKAVSDDEIPTPGEIQKMLVWAIEKDRKSWWLWMYIAATLGLRPSEVCGLRREDFDATRRLVKIERSVPDRADPSDWHMKTETSRRSLRVGEDFFDTLAHQLPDEGWLFEARARGGGRPRRTHTATPCWPPDAPNREMRGMRRQLGLSELYTPYSLRHFVATRLILQGKADIQVAKFLGTSVDMLQKVYANHLDHQAQRDIGEAVTNLF